MHIDAFGEYLEKEKNMAENSLRAYRRDVEDFAAFERERGVGSLTEASETEMVAYLHSLKSAGRSPSTINRKVASLRAFYGFLAEKGEVQENPTAGIKSPKVERKQVEFLTIQEIDRLLECPDDSSKGCRDRAIMEVLYATGIKVSELIAANVEDVNFRMGFITCMGEGSRMRIVPLGRPARAALENYTYDIRPGMLKGNEDENALFLNHSGKRISRQGLWKILREYGEKTGLGNRITPNTLRNSFAVHMLQNGADMKSLQELMGHEDISVIQTYLAATKNRIKEVYDRTHPRA